MVYTWAGWLVVAVTLDRFVLFFPEKRLATKNIAIVVVISELLCLVAVNAGYGFRWGVHLTEECEDNDIALKLQFQGVGLYILMPLYSFLPVLILFIFNIVLAVKLLQLRYGLSKTNNPSSRHLRKTRELTITVLVMSVAYALFTMPFCVLTVISFIPYSPGQFSPDVIACVREIGVVFVTINHSVNFYLYVLTSGAMRKAYANLWRRCCGCQQKKEVTTEEVPFTVVELGQVNVTRGLRQVLREGIIVM
jgi:hypothetical protein